MFPGYKWVNGKQFMTSPFCHIDPTTNVELWRELPKGLVKEGDTVEIRCQGDGNPPPPYTFNREQVRMDPSLCPMQKWG